MLSCKGERKHCRENLLACSDAASLLVRAPRGGSPRVHAPWGLSQRKPFTPAPHRGRTRPSSLDARVGRGDLNQSLEGVDARPSKRLVEVSGFSVEFPVLPARVVESLR